jgi:hypothetical protein
MSNVRYEVRIGILDIDLRASSLQISQYISYSIELTSLSEADYYIHV